MIARLLPIFLLTGSVALAGVIALEASNWNSPTNTQPAVQLATARQPGPDSEALPPNQHEDWLRQVLARPLFSPERRPLETGATGLPRLAGIVMNGSQRVAIFAGPSNGHPVLAEAGGHIGAYEIRSIADDGVTVVGPDGASMVKPTFDAARPASPTPRPPPPLPQPPRARAK